MAEFLVRMWYNKKNDMRFAFSLLALLLLLSATAPSAHAVPSLVPLLPLFGVVAVKIALFCGALFFFGLSLFKKHARSFSVGILLFVGALALLFIF
ncbi:hypothetical protein A2704_01040 [Candidatus Kaiserbacteria bacterium RIFCSPHIGHO2_01_FULL_54_36b]|uniref:DUF5658 domain-containing protein n=1 Tax=Candidatus Kaiserbacteria bacterium RIFCSPHIGHO2_01_FULL_54_36b TaxID=1798483 RepID=A0A1F6CL57_9BACT|nr:MAG: hypothetical protein A2704_01040 [Candidatus Kaiserbacteria bacterium RIFCSPHIGHO2_01_FULL_54_36b]